MGRIQAAGRLDRTGPLESRRGGEEARSRMTRLGHRLPGAARRLWHWVFPAEEERPEGLRQVLAFVFPRLDPRAASFHRGFPHLLNAIPNQAITLPASLRPGHTRVYVHPAYWDPGSVHGLGLLV